MIVCLYVIDIHIYIYIYILCIYILYIYIYTYVVVAEVLRRFAETVVFHCKMASKHCEDLGRRRIRPQTAQTNIEILAREMP